MLKKIFVKTKFIIWVMIYWPYYNFLYYLTSGKRHSLRVRDMEETVDHIIKDRCSVSRYGDGEVQIIIRYIENREYEVDTFQTFDTSLASRLKTILSCSEPVDGHAVCIPYAIYDSGGYSGYTNLFWKRFWVKDCLRHYSCFSTSAVYCDTNFTRFYMGSSRSRRQDIALYVERMKGIWNGQDICFVEGDKSRLGIGNDLFGNARSITRLLVPSVNAYSRYGDILDAVKALPKDKLYLLAVGQTATVLAYDMARLGYWAIDIGHVDIEYEWMRMGATHKVPVANKYVNEVKSGRISTDFHDRLYDSQIIGRIC